MTETVIINRVPETWGQKVEKAKLAEETQEDIKTEFHVPPHVGETVVLQPEQTAVRASGLTKQQEDEKIEEAHQAGLRDGEALQEPPDTEFSPAADLISEALKMYRDRQIDPDFKKQVIAAFKHLGLDTRKFFGV